MSGPEPAPSQITLPDGATLAYNIFGADHLGRALPIVLVGGLSSRRGDWDLLITVLAPIRPVLIYDHRGIGDSTYSSPAKDDHISVESLARDLLFLLESLRWTDIAICGFSMGGVVVQQLLFLPNHPTRPTPLPIRVTHVILAGTLTSVLRDRRYGIPLPSSSSPSSASAPPLAQSEPSISSRGDSPQRRRLTPSERIAATRVMVVPTFDPDWIERHPERFQWWLERNDKRPMRTILKQRSAMGRYDFTGLYTTLPSYTRILVIHGTLDAVIPRFCGDEVLLCFPRARMADMPSDKFGHIWWEYFEPGVWRDVIEQFLAEAEVGVVEKKAKALL